MKKPVRLIVWGWGKEYLLHFNQLRYLEQAGDIEIAGITGSALPPCSCLDSFPVIRIQEIPSVSYDYLMIMSSGKEKEITEKALTVEGVTRDRILSFRILDIPYFSISSYLQLKNRRISVISNTCWGGFFSQSLCLEHLSPFKNTFLPDDIYIRCLENLKHYCGEVKPVLKRWGIGENADVSPRFPVLALDDLEVSCCHDTAADTAIENWMRRRAKINWEDLFVVMTTERKESEKAFNALEQYPNRICFVPYETEMPFSLRVRRQEGSPSWFYDVNATARIIGGNITFSMIDLALGRRVLRAEA